MGSELLSVGLDVGTTTTQLVVSRLTAENQGGAFRIPRMEITGREVLYQSPVHLTPLIRGELVDEAALEQLLRQEYAGAGITPEDVDTGAVIITGETSRKENAEAVLRILSRQAGRFVVATAGPELESVLAARGAGAVEASLKGPVLHMDIGGGTSNLALCRDGQIEGVGCLNVGGRLVKFDPQGRVTYLSPVLEGLVDYAVGQTVTEEAAMETARLLAQVLEMAAGRREKSKLYGHFITGGTKDLTLGEAVTVSVSGGVADCVGKELPWLRYGDLGVLLGRAIADSSLCKGAFRLGKQTIRATVIGAGCHSTQLSGSTVFVQGAALPAQELPVAVLTAGEQSLPKEELAELVRRRLAMHQGGILWLPGWASPGYRQVTALADALAEAMPQGGFLAVEADMAKALGQAMALRLPEGTKLVCIDGIRAEGGDYLDIGAPVGPALTVVVKTLVFEK